MNFSFEKYAVLPNCIIFLMSQNHNMLQKVLDA